MNHCWSLSCAHLHCSNVYRSFQNAVCTGISGCLSKATALPNDRSFKPNKSIVLFDLSISHRLPNALTRIRFLSVDVKLEGMTFEHSGELGGLVRHPSWAVRVLARSSPDVSVLPSLSGGIAVHFRGPGELARARRGIVALNAHAMEVTNIGMEQGAAKGTITGRVSRDAITFCGRSRAPVTVDCHPDDFGELVRAWQGTYLCSLRQTRMLEPWNMGT